MNLEQWIGYCEHLTPNFLGIFDANVGKGGYTIFAQLIQIKQKVNLQGLPWCTTFVHAVIDRQDLLGKAHPGSRVLARRMKRKKYWRNKDYIPRFGDLIFLSNSRTNKIDHCGIVEKANENIVISVEGNTCDELKRFQPEQGGVVAKQKRNRIDTLIVGYAAIGDLL